jgi:hypothetical protein
LGCSTLITGELAQLSEGAVVFSIIISPIKRF